MLLENPYYQTELVTEPLALLRLTAQRFREKCGYYFFPIFGFQ